MQREERQGNAARQQSEDIRGRNGRRADYAERRFEQEGIRFLRSQDSDRFTVISSDGGRRYTFYAGTGLIMGPYRERGIEQMVSIAKGDAQ